MEAIIFVITIVAFIGSVILHEIAHGLVANHFGDDTAKVAGRLSLNPLVHIDPIGSILVPLVLFITNAGFLFGWAKPVPVNPFRMNGGASAYRWVAVAGIITNLILALLSALVLKFVTQVIGIAEINNVGVVFFVSLLQVNVVLAVFNALPFPGFDGWNFLSTFRPITRLVSQTPLGNPMFMAQYGLIFTLVLLFVFMPFIGTLFNFIFTLISAVFGI